MWAIAVLGYCSWMKAEEHVEERKAAPRNEQPPPALCTAVRHGALPEAYFNPERGALLLALVLNFRWSIELS